MKTLTFLLLFITLSSSSFSQESPFNSCWVFQDTTTDQESLSSIKLDSAGRVFLTLEEESVSQNIILDQNGNQIGSSSYPFGAVANSGNYYHSFNITDTGSEFTSIVIEKMSLEGNLLWSATIGSGNNQYDYIFELHTSGEDLIVTGWSSDYDTSGFEIFILKLDQTGNIEWSNTIDDEFPGPLIFLSSGNYLLQGYASVFNITNEGQILWQTTMNWPYYPTPSGLVEGNNGGCYVLTTTTDFDDPYANQLIFVDYLNVNGILTSATNYFYDENISTAKKDSKGNLILSSYEDYYGDSQFLILRKIDSALQVNWVQYDWQEFSDNVALVVDSDDHAIWLTNNGGYDGVNHGTLYSFNTDGTLEWQITKNGTSTDAYHPTGLDLRKDQELLLLGVDGYLTQNTTLNLEAIALDGTSEWETVSDTIKNTVYASLNKLDDENYFLAGKYYGSPVQQGRFCMKLCTDSTNIATTINGITIPDGTICNVYPNPVSSSATISFFLNENADITIELLDLNGKSLRLIANKNFSKGNHEVTFSIRSPSDNLELLTAGIYFLQLKTNQRVMVKKLILE